MKAWRILNLALVVSVLASGCVTESRPHATTALHVQSGAQGEPVFHDERIMEQLIAAGERFIRSGEATSMEVLQAQLKRSRCALDLPRPSRRKLTVEQIGERCRDGVVVIGAMYKCGKCDSWHLDTGTGFVLTGSGAIATCYHVVDDVAHKAIVVMTSDGRIHPVKEVLAADETNDIAILRIAAKGLKPVPLSAHARVGSRVFVIGHPEQKFYSFAEGIVSRYFTGQEETGDATMMSITADFGLGSSGCPVFNERGAVVGMADNIVSTLSPVKDGKAKAGIVFKHCRPAASILELIRPTETTAPANSEKRSQLARQ